VTIYRLLDTTRAYAAAKLTKCEKTDHIARRHAISYAKFIGHDQIIQSVLSADDLSKYADISASIRLSYPPAIVSAIILPAESLSLGLGDAEARTQTKRNGAARSLSR
jgi:hypothetical protein